MSNTEPNVRPVYNAGKRWSHGQERWTRHRAVICADDYSVEAIPERQAKEFICAHHYSGSFPAARLSVGLFRKDGPCAETRLVGVAVFSVPVQPNSIRRYCGLEPQDGVELGRFALLEEIPFNGESFFLSRAMRVLLQEKPNIRSILSYADPMERRDAHGVICKAKHAGQIYQATNALLGGRGKPRTLMLAPNGTVISERSLSKIRGEERGHAYAERQLVAAGAPPRDVHEDLNCWLDRVLSSDCLRRVRHPGNYAYVFPMDRGARKAALRAIGDLLPYPKIAT